MLTPYKYTLDSERNMLTVACRSENHERVLHTYQVQPQIFIEMDPAAGTVEEIIQILKDTLNTVNVEYNKALNRYVVIGNIEGIEEDLDSFFTITRIPMTISTALQSLNRKFYDQIEPNGAFSSKRAGGTNFHTIFWDLEVEIPFHGGFPSPEINPITIITFIRPNYEREVQIWTILPNVIENYSGGKFFEKEDVMLWTFYNMLLESDVDVTFNGKQFDWNYLLTRLNIKDDVYDKSEWVPSLGKKIHYKELVIQTLDHLDLYPVARYIYPEFTRHNLDTIAHNILGKGKTGLEIEEMRILTSAELNRTTTSEQKLRLSLLRNYALRDTQILVDLYMHFAPMLTYLAFLSGYNIGNIAQDNIFRGIMGYINPLIAYNDLNGTMPKEFLVSGIHKDVFVVSSGGLLLQGLISSDDEVTRTVGFAVSSIVQYTWIMKNIYQLEGLKPKNNEYTNIVGFKDGLAYFTQIPQEVTPVKKWSLFIVIGASSWIGVDVKEDIKEYTYKGMSYLCKHPFPAVRICVETYITSALDSQGAYKKSTAVTVTPLNKENMGILKKVTNENIELYRYLLTPSQTAALEERTSPYVPIITYYTRDKGILSLDPTEANIPTYRAELTKIMKTLPSL